MPAKKRALTEAEEELAENLADMMQRDIKDAQEVIVLSADCERPQGQDKLEFATDMLLNEILLEKARKEHVALQQLRKSEPQSRRTRTVDKPAAAVLPAPPASNEVLSLQGNPGMGPSSSHPRGAAEAAPRRQAITTSSIAKASSTAALSDEDDDEPLTSRLDKPHKAATRAPAPVKKARPLKGTTSGGGSTPQATAVNSAAAPSTAPQPSTAFAVMPHAMDKYVKKVVKSLNEDATDKDRPSLACQVLYRVINALPEEHHSSVLHQLQSRLTATATSPAATHTAPAQPTIEPLAAMPPPSEPPPTPAASPASLVEPLQHALLAVPPALAAPPADGELTSAGGGADSIRKRRRDATADADNDDFGGGLQPDSVPAPHALPKQSATPAPHAQPAAADSFSIYIKAHSGQKQLSVNNDMTIADVKAKIETLNLFAELEAKSMKLIYAAKELKPDTDMLSKVGLGKEATLHLLDTTSKRSVRRKEDDGEDDDDDVEEVELGLVRRQDQRGDWYTDFDAADGWATVEGINVGPIQEWLRQRDRDVNLDAEWIPYGFTGNSLQYFLDKSHTHARTMAQHLKEWFGPAKPKEGMTLAGFEEPAKWEAVPECVHTAVRELRQVLVCRRTGQPLLDDFELAFAQFTRMPVCQISAAAHPSGLAPQSVPFGRDLGAHWDSSGYLEVIITIGIFGEADVQLLLPPNRDRPSLVLPRERKDGITIRPGNAYALWAKSRWKMHHNAIVGRNEHPIRDLRGEIARVGVTLRFVRVSFAHIFGASHAPVPAPLMLRVADLNLGHTIVDAMYYDNSGRRLNEHAYPHTYPALVLDATGGKKLLVFYISDGLIPDDDEEAWSVGEVPMEHAVRASESIQRRCMADNTKAGRMTLRLMDDIDTGKYTNEAWRGVAGFVRAIRERGAAEVLHVLKQSSIVK